MDHVPVSAILEIHAIESVVVVEMQNVMYPFLESANPATRIQPSDVYSGTVYDRGYDGEGIVIAVLDSGVDNEHRSLNDFDDEDDDPDLDPNSATKSGSQDMMQHLKHPIQMVPKTLMMGKVMVLTSLESHSEQETLLEYILVRHRAHSSSTSRS